MKDIEQYFHEVLFMTLHARLNKTPIHTVSLESNVQIIRVHCVCIFNREEIFLHRIPVTQRTCWTLHCIVVDLFRRRTCQPNIQVNEKLQSSSRYYKRHDCSTSVAKQVSSLERVYLVFPYLKQCSLHPQERV